VTAFGDDLYPPRVGPVITDQAAWVAATAAGVSEYLTARASVPRGVEVSVVRLAGALLGVAPLGEAIRAIVLAMNMPTPPLDDYEPGSEALGSFAEAVNHARRRVYEYTENCFYAARAVLIDWGRKVDALTAAAQPQRLAEGPSLAAHGSDEDEDEALSECSVVAAEAESAEQRLLVFEQGLLRAIESAEHSAACGDVDVIARLTDEVRAAGARHSAPSTRARAECE
jgi:hypothetical protein